MSSLDMTDWEMDLLESTLNQQLEELDGLLDQGVISKVDYDVRTAPVSALLDKVEQAR